jgi:hypothetical protein
VQTLIIFNSLITGIWPSLHRDADQAACISLGERWQDAILDVADTHFLHFQVSPAWHALDHAASSSRPLPPPACRPRSKPPRVLRAGRTFRAGEHRRRGAL